MVATCFVKSTRWWSAYLFLMKFQIYWTIKKLTFTKEWDVTFSYGKTERIKCLKFRIDCYITTIHFKPPPQETSKFVISSIFERRDLVPRRFISKFNHLIHLLGSFLMSSCVPLSSNMIYTRLKNQPKKNSVHLVSHPSLQLLKVSIPIWIESWSN